MPPKSNKRKSAALDDGNTSEEEITKPMLTTKRGKLVSSAKDKDALKYDLEWKEHGELTEKHVRPLYYLWSKTVKGVDKVAGFDIDNTIIVTKSGRNFATNAQDWKWFDASLPKKLKELDDNGYRVIFFTNQAGIEKGNVKFTELQTKFQSMVCQLDIPIFIFIATGETHYRKPATEMWNFFVDNCNQLVKVDMKESFFVGDAAGRPKNWAPGKSKDFSCADRMFAANLGLKFYTPEEYFLNQKSVPFEWGSVDPNEILKTKPKTDETPTYHKTEQDMVLLMGPPASGKSTLVKRYFLPHNYVHVNRDTLGTQEKCVKAAEEALKAGKSVCIDNTNPSKSIRTAFVDLAKKYKLKSVRCFKMDVPLELCHHLNYVRQNSTKGKIRRIPDVGYNVFKKNLEAPELAEGFTEIKDIKFVPKFDSDEHENIFKQWTI